jgi:regulator of protease activity HflC (stomatin/prohibitin superfamily)
MSLSHANGLAPAVLAFGILAAASSCAALAREQREGITVRGIRNLIVAGIVGLFLLTLVSGSWYTVDAGEKAVVLTFGSISAIKGAGLHFKIPMAQSVHKVSIRVQWLSWDERDPMESYSKDQQPAKMQVNVAYRVLADDASLRSFYTTYRDIESLTAALMAPRSLEAIKTTFGRFNAVTAIQDRTRLNADVEQAVRKIIVGPVYVEGVQIKDITFSEAYEQSVEQRMLAQVEVEKVRQNKDREQLQADIKVIQATADAQSVKLRGEAEASAIRARGDALRDNPKLVELVAAEKWNGTLPTTMVPGSAVPFIEVPNQ